MALPEHCDISLPRSSCSLAGPWQALPVPVPPGRCNLKKRDFFDSSVGSKSTRPDRVESMARLSVRCRFSHDSEWNQAQRSGVSSFGRKLSTASHGAGRAHRSPSLGFTGRRGGCACWSDSDGFQVHGRLSLVLCATRAGALWGVGKIR